MFYAINVKICMSEYKQKFYDQVVFFVLSVRAIHSSPIHSDSTSIAIIPSAMTWRSQQVLQKNALSFNPFSERASAEPPLEWSKWTAIVKIAVFGKDGIENRN